MVRLGVWGFAVGAVALCLWATSRARHRVPRLQFAMWSGHPERGLAYPARPRRRSRLGPPRGFAHLHSLPLCSLRPRRFFRDRDAVRGTRPFTDKRKRRRISPAPFV